MREIRGQNDKKREKQKFEEKLMYFLKKFYSTKWENMREREK